MRSRISNLTPKHPSFPLVNDVHRHNVHDLPCSKATLAHKSCSLFGFRHIGYARRIIEWVIDHPIQRERLNRMFYNPFEEWQNHHGQWLPQNVSPSFPARPRNPWEKEPHLHRFQVSTRPPLQGFVTNDPEEEQPGIWGRIKDIGSGIGSAIGNVLLGGVAYGDDEYENTPLTGASWPNQVSPTDRMPLPTPSLVAFEEEPPFEPLGQFEPNFPNAFSYQPQGRRQHHDFRQIRMGNVVKQINRQEPNRNRSIGRILAENNTQTPFQSQHPETQGRMFSDVVSGGAQLGQTVWNGVNSFISPGAYAHAHDPYSDTEVIGSRPKNESDGLHQSISKNNRTQYHPPPAALEPVSSLLHYRYGGGQPKTVQMKNIRLPDITKHSKFPNFNHMASIMSAQNIREIPIDPVAMSVQVTNVLDRASLNYVNITLNGRIRLFPYKRWRFEGSITGADIYDFNKSTHRNGIAEWSTWVGNKIPGKNYKIDILGDQFFELSGYYD